MKTLRRTIRRIIRENKEHILKIVELIYTGDVANINQAIELAETMGYISDVKQSVEDAYYFPQDIHIWEFVGGKEFMYTVLDYKIPKNVEGFDLRSPDFKNVTIKRYVDQ